MPGIEIKTRKGDLADPSFVAALAEEGFDSLFHLASYLTFHAEEDPARAFAVNVDALRRLMESADNVPKVVFTSSIAVFGGSLPESVGDEVAPQPETTYGSHKAINELLLADHSRHGQVDGRSLRLPIVLTRPGKPQPAISDRIASIIREPLQGLDMAAPLTPETAIPVSSAGAAVAALLKLHDLPSGDLPTKRAFNLPSLTVTVAEMFDAVKRYGATGKITYAADARMQAIVDGWPSRFVSHWGTRLGLAADGDLDTLISDYLDQKGV
ncbi:NAD-dependent epimerase/dehydratase family protein [Fodinicurvata halophila]